MKKDGCIFCSIVAGEAPSDTVWEDEKHLAFLTIFPNTEGVTVVIPKEHHDSYFADVPLSVVDELLVACRKVAKRIDAAYDDVGRTGLVFEGFGVDHLHAKLFPLHETEGEAWREHTSSLSSFSPKYEGYISSHNGPRGDADELARVAKKIRGEG